MDYSIHDFTPGMRIEIHPACDLWMRGARFGTIQKVGRKHLLVKMDTLRKPVRVSPANVGRIVEGVK